MGIISSTIISFSFLSIFFRAPKYFLIFGKSGDARHLYQLAEWFGPVILLSNAFALRSHYGRACRIIIRAPENFNFWEEENSRRFHELHGSEVIDLRIRRQRYVKHFRFCKFFCKNFSKKCIFFLSFTSFLSRQASND